MTNNPFICLSAFAKNGWSPVEAMPSSKSILEITELPDSLLSYLNDDDRLLLTTYRSEQCLATETVKGIVRALIRYNPQTHLMAREVYRDMVGAFNLPSDTTYGTPPYVIMHLPNDTSEAGGLHRDHIRGNKRFQTIWIPLDDITTDALTIMPGSHRFANKLTSKLSRMLRLPRAMFEAPAVSPRMNRGSYLTWHGHTQHVGNRNQGAHAHLAVVLRMTDKPILSEPSSTVAEILRQEFASDHDTYRSASHALRRVVMHISDRLKHDLAANLSLSPDLASEYARFVDAMQLDNLLKKMVSYCFAMIALRRRNTRDEAIFGLLSVVTGQEYLYPLKPVFEQMRKACGTATASQFAGFLSQKYASQQVEDSLPAWARLGAKSNVNPGNRMPLYSWHPTGIARHLRAA